MKKVLLILISFSSFAFSLTCDSGFKVVNSVTSTTKTYSSKSSCYYEQDVARGVVISPCGDYPWSFTYVHANGGQECVANDSLGLPVNNGDKFCFTDINGTVTQCIDKQENQGGWTSQGDPICNADSVSLDGLCTLVPPNADGFNEDGTPNCKTGFNLSDGACIDDPYTNPDGTCTDGNIKDLLTGQCTPLDNNSETPNSGQTTNNPDGSSTQTFPDGSSTTTFPDGSTESKDSDGNITNSTPPTNSGNTGSTGTGGSDGISGGSSGSNGGSSGSDGNTSGESGTSGDSNDINPDPVADNCNDSSLSLEQKMLCELNEGMKKQNSESNPSNSLNNLMKDLIANNQTDNTSINTNLKDMKTNSTITNKRIAETNKKLDASNESLDNIESDMDTAVTKIGALKTVNASIVNAQNTTNEKLEESKGFLSDIKDLFTSPEDNGKAQVDGLDTFIDEETNFAEEIEATTGLKATITNEFNSYSDSLKNQLLTLFDSFFNINTSNLPPLGVNYDFNVAGKNFKGTFLDESMMESMSLDKLSNIIIFAFSLLGFFHAFNFVISNQSNTSKDK